MSRITQIGSWPLAWKVPLLVAALMVGIAAMISQVVLSRLTSDQENNLRLLTNAYLDGLSAAVFQSAIRADVWETFDALDRARSHYSGVDARYVIVELPDDKVLAASDPVRFPVRSVVPAELTQHASNAQQSHLDLRQSSNEEPRPTFPAKTPQRNWADEVAGATGVGPPLIMRSTE
jgi:hypothetical protein